MLVTGSACAGRGRSDVTRQVQILAFDGMEVLDYAGPYEVFNVAGEQTEWWFHSSGCREWFQARRVTTDNTVIETARPGALSA